ncbi:MAG: HRDC domain-containing protein [Kiritimatiellia bacterium]
MLSSTDRGREAARGGSSPYSPGATCLPGVRSIATLVPGERPADLPFPEELFHASAPGATTSPRPSVSRPISSSPPDKGLQAIAAARPTTEEELAKVWGMGPSKMRSYGEELLELVMSFRAK